MTRLETWDGRTYEVLAEHEAYQSYEWSLVALLRSEGQLYLYEDGGCSCNEPWSSGGGAPTPVASWQEAVARVQADPPYEFDDGDIAHFAEKCMTASH